MGNISRRDFLAVAAVLGAEAAWGRSFSTPSKISWRERRDLFPEGVASGDPDSNSVLLWTRRAPQPKPAQELIVEVALDQTFQRVIATQRASISAEAGFGCSVRSESSEAIYSQCRISQWLGSCHRVGQEMNICCIGH